MTLSVQFITMIAMIWTGVFFGVAFDTYNRLFQRRKRKKAIVFLNDILFWLLQGLLAFYILYVINQGEIRFYIFLALLCGFAAYQSLLKSGYLRLLEIMIATIVRVTQFVIKVIKLFIIRPLHTIALFLLSLILFTFKGLWALAKLLCHTLLLLIRAIFTPIRWIGLLLGKYLPQPITSFAKKLYNRCNSLIVRVKSTVQQWMKRMNKK